MIQLSDIRDGSKVIATPHVNPWTPPANYQPCTLTNVCEEIENSGPGAYMLDAQGNFTWCTLAEIQEVISF